MKAHDFLAPAIERIGGKWKRDHEGGWWQVEVNDFVLQAEPFLREPASRDIWLGFDCSLGHRRLAKLVNLILGDKPTNFVPLRWFQCSAEIPSVDLASDAYAALMTGLKHELGEESFENVVEGLLSHRPDGPSLPQANHLAALAWSGDTATLRQYQDAFAAGNRLNFVPMFDRPMIDRAVELSMQKMG
jgi:hypothetical protein